MICNKCSAKNDETHNFCNQCGNRLEKPKKESPIKEVESSQDSSSKLDLGGVQYGKVYVGFALVLLVILGTAFSSISSPGTLNGDPAPSASPRVVPSDVLSEDEILALSKEMCTSVNQSLSSEIEVEKILAVVKKNASSVAKASKDAWSSLEWKDENPSWFSGESYSDQVNANIKVTIASNTERLVKPLLDAEEFEGYMRSKSHWTYLLFQPVVYACGLTKTLETLDDYDSNLRTIASQAENLPWYPKGFTEIPRYPGFALGKANGSCSYSFGSCAIFNIVSQTACPTSLYVEANGLNGDVVTSWGNDTARVAAGQVARIEITFSENVDTWEMTNINCY
ncbi:MAG: hypothetical protein RLZ82_93 [Actinomycetota bacterium]|jgi:ribosomal protein L40E